ncbi:hypothetical protein PI85_12780 [Lysinibacillus sp. A1]|jgi:hypothetical protein|uniref:DUF1541 domain-containing protein n=3 Tax=Lysinibacillus TaxID=400634 RepID=A0A0N0UXH6_9BACI|nr:hypothetical protein HR49_01355 [Lysinibacillus fusiformis]KGR82546.1 hypothetical protein CD31_19130 [Lysinibacillus boronitolerans JCM 21713 = 10a = NBRC 103108]KHK52026.1 hypothetical protein PI85_12780 [Lysinibacillus sp. A1]KOY84257.1 hypothetical protein ADM90_00195 [Lysinibacillus macroides]
MMEKKIIMSLVTIVAALMLSACTGNTNKKESQQEMQTNEMAEKDMEGMDHSEMNPSSNELPEGLKEAENPKFGVGTKAIIHADHMKGMDGAEATIVGAYDTIVYTISYAPTNGGNRVTNHKWVIQEEIEGAGSEPFEPGTQVIINANHMEGMEGVTAKIDSAEETTVYVVDYTSTNGEKIKNHKWLTESELSSP